MKASIIIKNARCVTMENKEEKDWLAISGEEIIGLGNGNQYQALVDSKTILLDAKGNTVLPGFIDSHFHLIQTALDSVSMDLSDAKTYQDLGERIKEAYQQHSRGYIRGIRISEEQFEEKKFPSRAILDKYCSDAPLVLNSMEYQVSMLNTYALLYFKIPFTAEGVELDEKQMPTGIFRKQANAILRKNILNGIPDSQRGEATTKVMADILMNGITTINAMEGGFMYSDKDADFLHEYAGEFPIDIVLFYQTMDIDKIKRMNLKRAGGCFYIDGTFRARTAALSFEYADCPGTMGSLRLNQEEINDFVLKCYENGLQLALYTIGDRAIDLALKAHEKAYYQTGITGLRHRLEHVELAREEQIAKAKKLGIIFSMRPTYETYWGGPDKMYAQRLGASYTKTNPFKSIVEAGVTICGGSDSNVTEPSPLLGIHSAVNHPVEKHRVGIYEAIKMYTYNGAYAIFEEDKKGSLAIGKKADVVILDRDIFSVDQDKIKDIKVNTTIKSGEILFSNLK